MYRRDKLFPIPKNFTDQNKAFIIGGVYTIISATEFAFLNIYNGN